jgi:hypothetical protein
MANCNNCILPTQTIKLTARIQLHSTTNCTTTTSSTNSKHWHPILSTLRRACLTRSNILFPLRQTNLNQKHQQTLFFIFIQFFVAPVVTAKQPHNFKKTIKRHFT